MPGKHHSDGLGGGAPDHGGDLSARGGVGRGRPGEACRSSLVLGGSDDDPVLEKKGLLRHRQVGTKYVYRPRTSRESASRYGTAARLADLFQGSATDAVAAILDDSASKLTANDLVRLEQLIEQARKEGK